MTPISPTRRDILKGAVAVTTAASIGLATTRRSAAQEGSAAAKARIDGVFRQAVDAKEVPGVVAMAATDKGVLYEGAFGPRDLAKGPAMTLDTVFRIASMTKAVTSWRPCSSSSRASSSSTTRSQYRPGDQLAQVLDGFDAAGAPKLRPANDR